jgi:hypothetical protein
MLCVRHGSYTTNQTECFQYRGTGGLDFSKVGLLEIAPLGGCSIL